VDEHALALVANRALGGGELQGALGRGCRVERLDLPEFRRRPMAYDQPRPQELHGPETHREVHLPPRLDPGPGSDRGPALSPERTGRPAARERPASEEDAFLGEAEQGVTVIHAPRIPKRGSLWLSLWITVEGRR
jgi:hypothetical protein